MPPCAFTPFVHRKKRLLQHWRCLVFLYLLVNYICSLCSRDSLRLKHWTSATASRLCPALRAISWFWRSANWHRSSHNSAPVSAHLSSSQLISALSSQLSALNCWILISWGQEPTASEHCSWSADCSLASIGGLGVLEILEREYCNTELALEYLLNTLNTYCTIS